MIPATFYTLIILPTVKILNLMFSQFTRIYLQRFRFPWFCGRIMDFGCKTAVKSLAFNAIVNQHFLSRTSLGRNWVRGFIHFIQLLISGSNCQLFSIYPTYFYLLETAYFHQFRQLLLWVQGRGGTGTLWFQILKISWLLLYLKLASSTSMRSLMYRGCFRGPHARHGMYPFDSFVSWIRRGKFSTDLASLRRLASFCLLCCNRFLNVL